MQYVASTGRSALARIVTVYVAKPRLEDAEAGAWVPTDMSYIRWFRMSQALAGLGHDVDVAVPSGCERWPVRMGEAGAGNTSLVSLEQVDWNAYDMVKTLFHLGFRTLRAYGGDRHPLIVSKLGSVVAPTDQPGIHFHGQVREALYKTQCAIAKSAKYVALLTEPARRLWTECHGAGAETVLVPGAADRRIPAAGDDPYPTQSSHGHSGGRRARRALFAGHIYAPDSQAEANDTLCRRLNELGRLLHRRGIGLYMIGSGDVSGLDRDVVEYFGAVPYAESWHYLQHADVGVVVSAGQFMHNNESSKIYHYLRAGLPIVTESGFPNEHLVTDAEFGSVVASGDMNAMAEAVAQAASSRWDRDSAVRFALAHHTWDRRAATYDAIIRAEIARHA
jgi:glycosyltransferase involved in cell wall biosynthesis